MCNAAKKQKALADAASSASSNAPAARGSASSSSSEAGATPSECSAAADSASSVLESGSSSSDATGSSSTDLWPLISDWVTAKRTAGMTPASVLGLLGLELTPGTRDEDSVWAVVALAVAEHRQRSGPRRRLSDVHAMENVVELFRSCSNLLVQPSLCPGSSSARGGSSGVNSAAATRSPQVITGAAASHATGIPDFRADEGVFKVCCSPQASSFRHTIFPPSPVRFARARAPRLAARPFSHWLRCVAGGERALRPARPALAL